MKLACIILSIPRLKLENEKVCLNHIHEYVNFNLHFRNGSKKEQQLSN